MLSARGTADPLDAGQGYSFVQAQPHHQQLDRWARGSDCLARLLAVPLGFDGSQPALGHPLRAGRHPSRAQGQPAVSAGTDADIVAVAPVDEVVTALLARPGVVADLVGGQPGVAEQLAGSARTGSACSSSSSGTSWPCLDHGVEARAGLDGELVERQMAIGDGQRPAQLVPPGCARSGRAGHRSGRTSGARRWPAASSTAARASATVCSRPRKRRSTSSSAWTPSETRFTPAARKARKRPASTEVGLASSVISRSVARSASAQAARSITAATVSGRHQRGRAAAEEDRVEPAGPASAPRNGRARRAARGASARGRRRRGHGC